LRAARLVSQWPQQSSDRYPGKDDSMGNHSGCPAGSSNRRVRCLHALNNLASRKGVMIICEFCLQHQEDGRCRLGINLPRQMRCRDFDPGLEKFCSSPGDFVNSGQLIQMATYFGIKGNELKKIKLMAAQEERLRLQNPTT
jgi:hypothetical protein